MFLIKPGGRRRLTQAGSLPSDGPPWMGRLKEQSAVVIITLRL